MTTGEGGVGKNEGGGTRGFVYGNPRCEQLTENGACVCVLEAGHEGPHAAYAL